MVKLDEPLNNHVVPGYQRDGVSFYSHAATKGRKSKKSFADHDPLSKMIHHERYVIERLERRAAEARANPDPDFPPGRSPTFLGIC